MTIFVCRRQMDRPSCYVCHESTDTLCRFPLKGRKTGQHCDRPLCARHWVMAESEGKEVPMCHAHGNLVGAVQR